MTKVTLICPVCGATARLVLQQESGSQGTHETCSKPAKCPEGHGYMVRKDGFSNSHGSGES